MGQLQCRAAVLTETRIGIMTFRGALVADLGTDLAFAGPGNRHGYHTGGHGNNAITANHYQAGKELPQGGLRRNIPITHGGQGNDGPVHATGYAIETISFALDKIHTGTDNHHQRYYRDK